SRPTSTSRSIFAAARRRPSVRIGRRQREDIVLTELAAAVREGRVDPVDLVEESLRRIDASHATLNAAIALRADGARADAEASPRTGARGGLPLLVKDMARCAGMRTTFGSHLYADAPEDTIDDVVVARLRAAGAIVVGRSNTPAFGHTA